MKDKFIRFMRSRYGNDQLSSFLTWGGLIFMVLDAFIKTGIFYFLGLFMFAYGYVRIMSKNYDKRAAQNRWFMEHTAGVRNIFKRAKKQKEAGKEYKIFVCSKCQQMIANYVMGCELPIADANKGERLPFQDKLEEKMKTFTLAEFKNGTFFAHD